ncbi:MAG: hypothetical protein DI568_13740 [Sphingomonas sp.]|nr:MAG: hypothetical protein DI568_13740 [Sphingomonas sp.]
MNSIESRAPECEGGAPAENRDAASAKLSTKAAAVAYHSSTGMPRPRDTYDALFGDDLPANVVPLRPSPLDLPVMVTVFPDRFARTQKPRPATLRQMGDSILKRRAATKQALPLLKLATFGDDATDKGCLRHDGNMLAISGVEVEHDDETVSVDEVLAALRQANVAALVYTSPSHRADRPRWRILAPCSRELPVGERDALVDRLAAAVGDVLSGESWTPSQAYYFGGVGDAPDHRAELVDGRPIDLCDELDGLIPAEAAPAHNAEKRPPLTFAPGQLETELALIPIERLDDYFDWVTLGQALHHQFGGSDDGFGIWLTHSERSDKFDGDVKAMRQKYRGFGRNRRQPVTMATVRQWAQEARAAALVDQFDEDSDEYDSLFGDDDNDDDFSSTTEVIKAVEPGSTLDWVSLLDINEEGAIKGTLHNTEMIVLNDSRLIGLPQLNQFTMETVQRTPPGHKARARRKAAKPTRQLVGPVWDVRDRRNGELWSSARDAAVRSILEAPKTQGGYGLKITDRDLKAAVTLAAYSNCFHPVREYLSGLKWDGVLRVEQLFIKYMGAPDNAYTRDVARLMMTAAVTRIFEPGHKWDFAVILEGLQGKRKSTFIQILGKNWSAELEGDFHDGKEMVEKMQGAWIMEIPELSAFNRSDVRSIKAFVSRTEDKVRLAYEARAQKFPRQCILIGSTNDREYLKDDTGGRRFFPIECTVAKIDTDRLHREVDQLWAEAMSIYRAMRKAQPEGTLPLYLDNDDAAREAERLQESRRVETSDDALAGVVAAWLAAPIRTGDIDDETEGKPREITCLPEVWRGIGNAGMPKYQDSLALGRAMALAGWVKDGGRPRFANGIGQQASYVKRATECERSNPFTTEITHNSLNSKGL